MYRRLRDGRVIVSRRATTSALLAGALLVPASGHAAFGSFERNGNPSAFPGAANGKETETPTISAYRLKPGERVDLDGKLDDACWHAASTGCGFRVWDPDRGADPSVETMFKVAYDADAFYFAVACHDDDPTRIARTLSRRDRFTQSDFVSIYVDPYHDKTTGYNFRANPAGVEEDRYVYDDGDTDRDWDAVWEVETHQDADGWYAEFRIPFSQIRYRPDNSTWGIQVRRWLQARGEDHSWSVWDRNTSGFVSRFGTLTGLEGIPNPRQLEVLPYIVARATDPVVSGDADEIQDFENFGLDLKYGITSDLSLNATFQPDFGQVEADPAVLNLSPFETFFSEKRPFFIEGARFFDHPSFNLFYSRRIGTGSENARIRYAGKLTGKTGGDVSIAALVAATDVTDHGKAHNFFRDGDLGTKFFVGRLGKNWSDGKHRVNVMQTAVSRGTDAAVVASDVLTREAYTTGVDFQSRFADRTYIVSGSFVGTYIDHEDALFSEGAAPRTETYGTGGELSIRRSGTTAAGTGFRWESDRLDLNDMGFLSAPDEIDSWAWLSYNWSPDGTSDVFNSVNVNLNLNQSWIYGDRTGFDLHTGEKSWRYSKGHPGFTSTNANGWMQFRGYGEAWWGLQYTWEGTQRFETRSRVRLEDGATVAIPGGGPLIDEPTTYGAWWGALTDSRKDLFFRAEGSHFRDTAGNHSTGAEVAADWTQSSAITHEAELGFRYRFDDTQHLQNFENPGGGIGGVSYVFGKIRQRTLDLTLRSSVLFSRNSSLEIYAQPFITVGNHKDARELVTPDTYDLRPYSRNGFRASDRDFTFSAVNLNVVYRWEYLPGSTLFLVWTHSRSDFGRREFAEDPKAFQNPLSGRALFENEPENVVLLKVSYWLPI